MSDTTLDAAAVIDLRLARDGVTVSAAERQALIDKVPVAQDWMRKLSIPEARYAEPAITPPMK